MEIELYFAEPVGAPGELFRAMQRGNHRPCAEWTTTPLPAPVMCLVFGGYFPFASRYKLDVRYCSKNTGSRNYGKKPMERF